MRSGLTWLSTLAFCGGCLLAPPSFAQSAADKATARQLAVQGIKDFEAGKHAEALDQLERAQQLYDAPVHLIYIARAQVKLGRLVEAAENYRALALLQLGPKDPRVFRDAVADAKKELPELEPRIPKLRIEVEPADAEDLEIKIDDQVMPTAALGTNRPVDPGKHRVRISAKGYASVDQEVVLKEGASESVSIELRATKLVLVDSGKAAGEEESKEKEASSDSDKQQEYGKFGFMGGLRLGATIPVGAIETRPDGTTLAISDVVTTGGGFELRGGLRAFRYFTGFGFLNAHRLTTSKGVSEVVAFPNQIPDPSPPEFPDLSLTSAAVQAGMGLAVGTPRGETGGYGEIGLAFVDQLILTGREATFDCNVEVKLSGMGLRLGGAASLPISRLIQLTPFVSATFGKYTSAAANVSCSNSGKLDLVHDIEKPETHTLLFMGIGGELLFGAD